ncbi:MAG TPA: hypothetical protein VKK61_07325, partial [Tepidisphaeraceae bacterium]|nr:hypothetical protein [Tepidisphaeraceae bacterium]
MRYLATFLSILTVTSTFAANPGTDDYLQGLDSLANKKWPDAESSFSKATAADDENANYHAACAIASMMANDTNTAKQEFDRALRLDPQNQTTQLWAAGFYRMIGQALVAAKIHATSDYTGTVQEAAERV